MHFFKDKFKKSTGSFSTKIFYLFTASIIVIYFSFTAFFIYYQRNMLKDHLSYEGKQLARLLANDLRLGVFAENDDLLKVPLEGIMQYNEAIMVEVYTDEGKQLMTMAKSDQYNVKDLATADIGFRNKVFDNINKSKSIVHFKRDDNFEFWAPVISGGSYSEEGLYFRENISLPAEYIIGYVRIVLTTNLLKKDLRDVLVSSILIPILFIIPGWLIAYFIVIGITRPLKRLTQGVKDISTDKTFEKIPVETTDEIGKLAMAFNEMAVSLKKREVEKQELEEQLRHAQKMEAVGTLAGGIAHDFNNIISVIRGYGRMLQKDISFKDKPKQYIEQILSSSARASTLTRRLLTFGRKQIIDPAPVSINFIIRNVEQMLERLINEDIKLKLDLSSDELIVVADTMHIEQVLMNLVANAGDAMPGGGCLTITTKQVNPDNKLITSLHNSEFKKYAAISVEDTGVGIEKEVKEKIFDPFFTTKDVGEGTGLGLSVVYGIIKQHQGHIEVNTKPGRGATFTIFLPLSDSLVQEKGPDKRYVLKGGTETVLIAEDDEFVRHLMVSMLEQYGYNVIEAIDGNDALDKYIANKDKVRLLLLDIIMPKRKGNEVYNEIEKISPDIKVLFVSGHSAGQLNSRKQQGKEINYLSKPILLDKLLHKVREILDKE